MARPRTACAECREKQVKCLHGAPATTVLPVSKHVTVPQIVQLADTKPRPGYGVRHIVIPDCQQKEGVPNEYLRAAGEYIAHKKPDVLVNLGDFADMPSLSSYDRGKLAFEGRRYKKDVEYARSAMAKLMTPIHAEIKRTTWRPRMLFTGGNHEYRIEREVQNDARLEGLISIKDLGYEEWGWTVYPFLQPVIVDGVAYAHYFTSGVKGMPITTARALVTKKHMSCIAGHQQTLDMDMSQIRGDGRHMIGIIAGSFYEHDEEYLGPQGNSYRRQLLVLNEVDKGDFDPMIVSLGYLKRRYLKRGK